jgi:hypothetical protein
MKSLMLICGNDEQWASFPAGAWPEAIAKQDAFNGKYRETGETIASFYLLDVESQDRALASSRRMSSPRCSAGNGYGQHRTDYRTMCNLQLLSGRC